MSDLPPRLTSALADRYRLHRQLGEGGMATVYLTENRNPGGRLPLVVLNVFREIEERLANTGGGG